LAAAEWVGAHSRQKGPGPGPGPGMFARRTRAKLCTTIKLRLKAPAVNEYKASLWPPSAGFRVCLR